MSNLYNRLTDNLDNQQDNVNKYLHNVKTIINNLFADILRKYPSPCPILQEALEYTMLSNGKNLRAALVFATCYEIYKNQLISQTNQGIILLNAACAVELLHTYSIIHDDLPAMDDDDFRRGKPSCHKKFNEATAILIGDCLQSLAFSLLSEKIVDPVKQLKIIQILSQAIGHQGMVAGQSLELNQETQNNARDHLQNTPDINKLNQIHNLKTGALFTACIQIGATINDFEQNSDKYMLLSSLGKKIGLAFQIQDDILDYNKSSIELGKPAKSDAKRNLPTYSNIIDLNQAQAILNQLWQESDHILDKANLTTSALRELIAFIRLRQF